MSRIDNAALHLELESLSNAEARVYAANVMF